MDIKDPHNLLGRSFIPGKECLPYMILEIPAHGIPIHPTSVNRLIQKAKTGEQLLLLQPRLPVFSDLDTPSYPTLAYLYPQGLGEPFICALKGKSTLPSGQRIGHLDVCKVDEIDQEESIHYYSKYYGNAINPTLIRVVVGNMCNLNCVMCPYHSKKIKLTHKTDFFQGNRAMSWDMMKRLARDCGAFGSAIAIGSVEEPLLHPDIYRFIRLCREEGVPHIHITTNGQLLNNDRARLLLEAGITSLDISLDALDAETYFQIRGSDLHRVEANIENFIRLRDQLHLPCHVRTSLVRNPEINPDTEEKFKQKWMARADSVFILNLAKFEDNNIHLSQKNQKVESLVEYYLQHSNGRWPCTFPFSEMAVLPDGKIYYCIETLCRLGFDMVEPMGDYYTHNLLEIWQGEAFQNFRKDLVLNQLQHHHACQDCEMWRSQVRAQTVNDGIMMMATEVAEIYQRVSY